MEFKNIKYLGCFASDEIPDAIKNKNIPKQTLCCIINTHTRKNGGQHWIALVRNKKNKIVSFDSFDRKTHTLNPDFPKKWIETATNNITKQAPLEINCGARCISFLKFADMFGLNKAMKI